MDLTTLIPVEKETETPPEPPSLQMFFLGHTRGSGDGSTGGEMLALFRPTLGQGAEERYATRQDQPNLIEQQRYTWRDLPAEGEEPARPLATASRTVMLFPPPVGHPLRASVQASFAVLLEAINTGLAGVSSETRTAILQTAGVAQYPLPTLEGLLSSQVGVLLTPWAEKSEG
jgi:hypothetical protein